MRRVRRAFGALGLFGAGAILFSIFGVAFLISTAVTTTGLLWTGQAVHGVETGGNIVYYWHGQSYSLDDIGSNRNGRATVFIDPSNPQTAIIDRTSTRVTNGVIVLGPFVVAAGFIVGGLVVRKRRGRRLKSVRQEQGPDAYGLGLDPTLVSRMLDQQRAASRPGASRPTRPNS